jgi:hypothetical protein
MFWVRIYDYVCVLSEYLYIVRRHHKVVAVTY